MGSLTAYLAESELDADLFTAGSCPGILAREAVMHALEQVDFYC